MDAKFFHCLFWVLVALKSCPVAGQDSLKKRIDEADYGKWGDLKINSVSESGTWCSYSMSYDNHNDTLFVQGSQKKKYSFPKGREGKFLKDDAFAYLVADTMKIMNLQNQKSVSITGIARYEIVCRAKFILSYSSNKKLELRRTDGTAVESISDVSGYKTNDAGTAVVYVRKTDGIQEVGYLQFENGKHKRLLAAAVNPGRFSWQPNGKSVVFANDNTVYNYRFTEDTLYTFEIKSITGYESAVMAKGGFTNLTISDDGEKVFFSIINPNAGLSKNSYQEVEIWNGNDTCLFPTQQLIDSADIPKLAVWFPARGSCKVLSDDSRFNVRLTSGGDYVMLSNPYTHVLTSQYPKRMDYYLKNVTTGAELLLLEQHSEDTNQTSFSPLNNSIVYYKDKNWWLYNPESDIKTIITNHSNHSWDTADDDDPAHSGAYGVACWTADGKYVLLYDRYDIWKAALDGSGCVRLTKGRENNMIYRLSKSQFEGIKFRGYESNIRNAINLSKDIIIETTNSLDWSNGYTVYNEKDGFRTLIYGKKKYSGIKRTANGKYLFMSETFTQAPQIELYGNGHNEVLFQSNRHQDRFEYGRSELVHFKNSNGDELKGALFYPAGYKKDKKYPMIVKIYEQLSGMVHNYIRPSFINSTGFNTSVFTANGYFVLFPDIKHIKGSPGISANDCVNAAVREVVATHSIDEKRIGLIGHSFGGYETDFILTQTSLFAAAVSGAGIGNTIGSYFALNTNGGGAEDAMWRFESQQMRMGIPFFSDKQSYLDNSPLFNAQSIKTPLLQWAGKNDVVVPYEQSVNLYLALRKLKSKTILLVYPEEGHSFSKEGNQRDLTRRILQWFDYYLKGKTDAGWITVGTTNE